MAYRIRYDSPKWKMNWGMTALFSMVLLLVLMLRRQVGAGEHWYDALACLCGEIIRNGF